MSAKQKTFPRKTIAPANAWSVEKFSQAVKTAVAQSKGSNLGLALRDAGVISPVVIVDDQDFRIRRLIQWLRDSLSSGNKEIALTFFGSELAGRQQVDQLTMAITATSLFCPFQLITIYEADKIKSQFADRLAEIVPKCGETKLIVLCAVNPGARAPLLDHFRSKATHIRLDALKGETLKRWIERELGRLGHRGGIEPPATQLLLQNFGEHVATLAQELEKLTLLVPPNEAISLSLVKEVCSQSAEHSGFELITQIARKNVPAAVMLGEQLVRQGQHPLQVLSFLSRVYRMSLANHDRSLTNEQGPADLHNPWFLKNISHTFRLFSAEELKRSIVTLRELDRRLKSSGLSPVLLLSLTIERLAARQFLSPAQS